MVDPRAGKENLFLFGLNAEQVVNSRGWYDLTGFSLERNDFHGFIAGHSFGQYVSGLARAYAVTGSEATRAKVNRLVKGYGGGVVAGGPGDDAVETLAHGQVHQFGQ